MKCDFCSKEINCEDTIFIYKDMGIICKDCINSLNITNNLTFIQNREIAIKELNNELAYYNAMVKEYQSNLNKTPKDELTFIDTYKKYVFYYKDKVYQTELLLKKLKD